MAAPDEPVLITGGAGFVGSYVARTLLDRGRAVVLFDLHEPLPEARFVLGDHAGRATFERGSIDDWPRLFAIIQRYRPRQLVHLGGIVDTQTLFTNPSQALRVNLEGTINVLEAARLLGVERVVYASSIGVLPAVRYEPIDAAHPIILPRQGPASGAYGASKVAGEAFCFAYQQAFGLDFRAIRFSAVYGFGMRWHSANYMKQFVEPAVRGEPVRLPTGGPLPRDYVHALDIASLVAAVLEAPDDADRIFYGATGEPLVTAAEAARLVMDLVPGADLHIGDVLSAGDHLEMGFRGRISIENARQQLGWSPTYRSLRDGIGEYIARYRAFLSTEG